MLVIDDVTTYGIGYSVLARYERLKSFPSASRPTGQKAVSPTVEAPLPAELVMEFTLSEDELKRGWTPERMADYLAETQGVRGVYVGEENGEAV